MLLFAAAAACALAYVLLRRRDRRMLRNGVLLAAAVFFAFLGVVDVSARRFPVVEVLLVGLIALMPIALLVLAAFLVANGVRMFRREGRSLGNTLSLIAGVAVVAVVAATILLLRTQSTTAAIVLALLVGIAAYVGAVFCVFLLTAVVYGRIRLPARADVVVVLGAGLRDGRVTPLLRSRLDRALEVYRRSAAAGTTPLMIPSGGQGDDEPRAEGTAMAEYLVENGVPPEQVRAETRSTNTRENLVFSREVQQEAGVDGTVVVVTNEYHVMRSAMLARELGTNAQVVGAPTARYYVPSAFLRELLAVINAHRRLHAVALAAIVVIWGAVLVVSLRG
jgi:uncharacterized SAM-binding protein YcdF (DUF218 family)